MISVKASVLYDGLTFRRDVYILIEGNKIVDVATEKPDVDIQFEGVVTPAIIDAHSHIGMARHSEPSNETEVNELADLFIPDLDPLDSVYFDDKYFDDAVSFGVLYSCIIPGSGNVIGGKAVVIRNFASDRREAAVRYIGYKMALGYNPRSTFFSWRGKRFFTRMGVYAYLIRKFDDILRKRKKLMFRYRSRIRALEKKLNQGKITHDEYMEEIKSLEELYEAEWNTVERAIIEILDRKKRIKVHVHKEDDVVFLVQFMKRYNLIGMADHLGDVHRREIFEYLRDNGIPVVYGPIDSFAYKTELKHDSYRNVKMLIESGVDFTLMSDHPVTLSRNLLLQLRYFLMYGLKRHEAISKVTYMAAKILGIDDILGTVQKGKLASIVIWNDDPFILGSRPTAVIAEGRVIEVPE